MVTQGPLQLSCQHLATPQEHERDPAYRSCSARPGEPCVWANRYDGLTNPPFHTERLEAASAEAWNEPQSRTGYNEALDPAAFRDVILNTGLF